MIIGRKMVDRTLKRAGVECYLYPSAGSFTETRGFLSTRTDTDILGNRAVVHTVHTLTVTREDGDGMRRGDRVIADETDYTVDEVDRGTAGTTLTLRARKD